MKAPLTKKVMSSSRGSLSKKAVIDRLKKEYKIVTDENVLKNLTEDKTKEESDTSRLVTINDKSFL